MPVPSRKMPISRPLSGLAFGFLLGLQPVAVLAQEATVDCRVVPHENADDEQRTDRTIIDPVDPDGDKLGDCEGVLAPPAVGDPDLVEPAPDVGETPVLSPQAVPAQPQGQ